MSRLISRHWSPHERHCAEREGVRFSRRLARVYYERAVGQDGWRSAARATTATARAQSAAPTENSEPVVWEQHGVRNAFTCLETDRKPSSTRSTLFGREHRMAIGLDEPVVDLPVDRPAVDAHEERMLAANDEAHRDPARNSR